MQPFEPFYIPRIFHHRQTHQTLFIFDSGNFTLNAVETYFNTSEPGLNTGKPGLNTNEPGLNTSEPGLDPGKAILDLYNVRFDDRKIVAHGHDAFTENIDFVIQRFK